MIVLHDQHDAPPAHSPPRISGMSRRRFDASSRASLILLTACGLLGANLVASARAAHGTLEMEVDARELPRKLLHTRIRMSCEPGPMAIWYPKWIPGTHAPCGPLDTIGGLRLRSLDGKAIPWKRDELDLYRVTCEIPPGVRELKIELDIICNEPAVDAAGYLSYGNGSLAILNWPTCLVYPEGPTADELEVRLTLRLPERWKTATSLKRKESEPGVVTFEPVSLNRLGDAPLIAGEHLRSIPLATGPYPPAFLDVASESPGALQLEADVIELYSRVVREAGALFGACHYPEFHFLTTCSDELGYLGLEHLTCSINGVRERDLIDASNRKGWVANLLPHEYVHSWCGKYRRPAGQCTSDFHTPQRTSLLWVYEGLTEYLGELLMVRGGLATPDEYRETLGTSIGRLMLQSGRKWRSLEDTAVASPILRAGSRNWNELRRSQDYYPEGALLWMEADAIIRERTEKSRSLDDFCRKFLGEGPSDRSVIPYDLADVVRCLKETCDYDWEPFLVDRVQRPLDELPLKVVERIGYRLQYSPKPGRQARGNGRYGPAGLSAQHSLGLSFRADGQIIDVVPGMAGDRAHLAPGMKVMGINGRLFNANRLQDALAESVSAHKIELLLLEGDRFRTLVLEYSDGPKYLELVRDESRPDVLADILKPIADKK
jgi:predicted metalloprotease with PDZ domain